MFKGENKLRTYFNVSNVLLNYDNREVHDLRKWIIGDARIDFTNFNIEDGSMHKSVTSSNTLARGEEWIMKASLKRSLEEDFDNCMQEKKFKSNGEQED
ncbi:replication protein A 70 kDa DNA-binding subunit A-like [Salvia divinorum]|uniref:Replication protein A 70 kDa DNA-binding subunit A-like n=1 Tax=Salvia divinorum TaxID=28513 RepID=A0ABD1GTJ3_SALDI